MTHDPNDTVTVYISEDGWRWRRQAANGEIIATSGEAYVDRGHALEMADRVNSDTEIREQDE